MSVLLSDQQIPLLVMFNVSQLRGHKERMAWSGTSWPLPLLAQPLALLVPPSSLSEPRFRLDVNMRRKTLQSTDI